MSQNLNIAPSQVSRNGAEAKAVFERFIAKAAGLGTAWTAWRRYRDDVTRLQSMDERMLKDIGLTRSEIGTAVLFGRYGG
jgi:uncharacterized protein YjiS (DUF1127 family)